MPLSTMLKENIWDNQNASTLSLEMLKIYPISLTATLGSVKPASTYYHYIHGGLELRRAPKRLHQHHAVKQPNSGATLEGSDPPRKSCASQSSSMWLMQAIIQIQQSTRTTANPENTQWIREHHQPRWLPTLEFISPTATKIYSALRYKYKCILH